MQEAVNTELLQLVKINVCVLKNSIKSISTFRHTLAILLFNQKRNKINFPTQKLHKWFMVIP